VCIAFGAFVAALAILFLGRASNAPTSSTPTRLQRPEAAASAPVASGNDRTTTTPDALLPDTENARDALEQVDQAAETAPGITNPSTAAERDAAVATRIPAADQPLATARAAAGDTAEVPLSWCFRETGFAREELQAGLAPQHDLSSDTAVAYQGSASARIAAADGSLQQETVGVMWQGVDATPFRGKRVEVSAAARPRITRVGHFFVRTQAAGPLELRLSDQGSLGARGINQYIPRQADWDRYRVVHDVPTDAEVVYYGFALFGGGNVWIDDVRISIVDRTAGLSHYGSVAHTGNIAIDPAWILPAPLNLDFELTSAGPTGGAEASHPGCAQPGY
jgi:hypothetical protein